MMFILVFRPHQRPAWAANYREEDDFVSAFQRGAFASSCHAPCTTEEQNAIYDDELAAYQIAFDAVGHDLYALTRLDSAEEVAEYLTENGHNKGLLAVEREAREIGWIEDGDVSESA